MGNAGLLVHDFSFVLPVSEPFDRHEPLRCRLPANDWAGTAPASPIGTPGRENHGPRNTALLCLLADGGKPAEPTAADRAAYEAAAAKAGKNAAAHVQLALWCEAHGLSAERIKHLNLAVVARPGKCAGSRPSGPGRLQGKWAKPEQVEQEIADDPKYQDLFREYLDRRVRTPQRSAEAQLRLAAWCLENGLKDEAMAHYHLVTRLDPSRDIAWISLGYKKHKDRWVKPDDLAAQKLEADRQKRADTQWKPRLEKLRDGLESSSRPGG